jgi:hypothetical protein
LHGYLADQPPDAAALATVMEIACAADHGTVDGYERRDGAVRPVLRQEHNADAQRWGLALMQETIVEFARHFVVPHPSDIDPTTMRATCIALVNKLWNSPTQSEAAAWGSFPFASDQSGSAASAIAQPLSLGHLARRAIGLRPQRRISSWHEGSVAISSPPVRAAIRAGRGCKRFVNKISGGLNHSGNGRREET